MSLKACFSCVLPKHSPLLEDILTDIKYVDSDDLTVEWLI